MTTWTLERPMGNWSWEGKDDDGEVVASFQGYNRKDGRVIFNKIWVRPDLRGNDEFATSLYIDLAVQAKEAGLVTDEDLANYSWDGGEEAYVGNVTIIMPAARKAMLRFRVIGRSIAEESAAAVGVSVDDMAPLSFDTAQVVEYRKGAQPNDDPID